MTPIHEALLLGLILLAIALLAVFGIIPEAIAQYAPLAVVPFLVRGRNGCAAPLGKEAR